MKYKKLDKPIVFRDICIQCASKDIRHEGVSIMGKNIYLCENCLEVFSVEPSSNQVVNRKKAAIINNMMVIF